MEMMGSRDEGRRGRRGGRRSRGEREGDRWRGKVVVEGLSRGKEGEAAAVRRGEERGRRLESQDLRLFWLDGSQML